MGEAAGGIIVNKDEGKMSAVASEAVVGLT
jgi:hypothetical protein